MKTPRWSSSAAWGPTADSHSSASALRPWTAIVRAAEHRRLESCAGVDGGPGEALGQAEVVTGSRRSSGTQQQCGIGVAAGVEPPNGHSQDVVGAAGTGHDHCIGHLAGQVPRPEHRHLGPQDVAVDGVSEPDQDVGPGRLDPQQAQLFKLLQIVGMREGRRHAPLHRFSERHDLQRSSVRRGQPGEAHLDQLHEKFGRTERAAEAPHAALEGEHGRFLGSDHQLPQEQDVSFGVATEGVDSGPVHRPFQRHGQ